MTTYDMMDISAIAGLRRLWSVYGQRSRMTRDKWQGSARALTNNCAVLRLVSAVNDTKSGLVYYIIKYDFQSPDSINIGAVSRAVHVIESIANTYQGLILSH